MIGKTYIRRVTETETTWADIQEAAKHKQLGTILQSGDYIPLMLKDGRDIGLDIGRDENGRTYFIFHNSPQGGDHNYDNLCWRDSHLRNYEAVELFDLLPPYIQEIITPTRVVQYIDGERVVTEDKLFCLSKTQVFGWDDISEVKEQEDSQIDIFKDFKNRQKKFYPDDQPWKVRKYIPWWLRTNDLNQSNRSYKVDESGDLGGSYCHMKLGTIFAFCIE